MHDILFASRQDRFLAQVRATAMKNVSGQAVNFWSTPDSLHWVSKRSSSQRLSHILTLAHATDGL